MSQREVSFNARSFWGSIKHKKCKRKLKGALVYLERKIAKGPVTEDMVVCKVYLSGRVGEGG